ncbi:MAG: gas vesicle protein GvpJ [Bacillota bacterium]
MQPIKSTGGSSLLDVVDRILDKGIIINADITISLVGVELLGIKIRAAVASFETAAKYGLSFPNDLLINEKLVAEAKVNKEVCPECGKISPRHELLTIGCPWCGWISARARLAVAN